MIQAEAGGHVTPRLNHTRMGRIQHCADYTIKNELNELIGDTYTNKIHLLFGSPSLKNSILKSAWLGPIMGWVAFWKAS